MLTTPCLPGSTAETPDRRPRRAAIVDELVQDIVQGRLPVGQHLVTDELARRFQVSHTPIREALMTLGGLGLVTLQPHRGAVVREFTPREIRDVCRVRRALECEAVREACGLIARRPLQELKRQLQQLSRTGPKGRESALQRARDLDNALHDLIATSTGNEFLIQEINRLKCLFRGLRDVAWQHDRQLRDYGRIAEETSEHLAVVDALLAHERSASVKAMSRHLLSGLKYWSRALKTQERVTSRLMTPLPGTSR